MIAGAVTYDCKNSFLHHFQQLDLASLQGATIGSFGIGKGLLILLKFAVDAVLIHKSHSFLTTTKMQYLILSSLFYPFLV
jgi:hypothetical protein